MRFEDLPRLNELRARSADLRNSYFTPSLDAVLLTNAPAQKFFQNHEQNLSALTPETWAQFLEKAVDDRVCVRTVPVRANQRLFDFLNEAKAYIYLQRMGCKDITFVAKSPKKTPDLRATHESQCVVCEVKTLNRSHKESNALSVLIRSVEWERGLRTRGVSVPQLKDMSPAPELGATFFTKLTDRLKDAKAQMDSFCADAHAQKIAYLVFDVDSAEVAAVYEKQIRDYLADHPIPGIACVLDMNGHYA